MGAGSSETLGTSDSGLEAELPGAMREAAYLVEAGPFEPKLITLAAGGHVIGRGGGSDTQTVIDDPRASKKHIELALTAGTWFLTDLASRNGTYLNGSRLPPRLRAPVTEGAVIRAGDTNWVFRHGRAPVREAAAEELLPGLAPSLCAARERLCRVAALDIPILIMGDTGTGKEFAAQLLHARSSRAARSFVPVNCAELSATLGRSELFGNERGAFTGAVEARRGLVDAAEHGTLFLDEVGDLNPDMQTELLRFLNDGSYRAVGGTTLKRSDARIVAATRIDLDAAVAGGHFRQDLLARLRGYFEPILLPPLRDRREDIIPWAQRFVRDHPSNNRDRQSRLGAGFIETLLLHSWPENLRELRMAISSALVLSAAATLDTKALPDYISKARSTARRQVAAAMPAASPATATGSEPTRDQIVDALRRSAGVVSRAAKLLQIERRKFYRLLNEHSIDPHHLRGT